MYVGLMLSFTSEGKAVCLSQYQQACMAVRALHHRLHVDESYAQ